MPSLGQYYSLDTEIRIRTMTVCDVKYLATFNKTNAITITNELLQRCLKLKHLKFEDILLADREYLLFWLRTNTFIRSSGYQIKIPECPTCKNSGWLELCPCGMIHPNVLEESGIDSTKYSGFAFGIGLTRLAMMKYKINDIRVLNSGDLK